MNSGDVSDSSKSTVNTQITVLPEYGVTLAESLEDSLPLDKIDSQTYTADARERFSTTLIANRLGLRVDTEKFASEADLSTSEFEDVLSKLREELDSSLVQDLRETTRDVSESLDLSEAEKSATMEILEVAGLNIPEWVMNHPPEQIAGLIVYAMGSINGLGITQADISESVGVASSTIRENVKPLYKELYRHDEKPWLLDSSTGSGSHEFDENLTLSKRTSLVDSYISNFEFGDGESVRKRAIELMHSSQHIDFETETDRDVAAAAIAVAAEERGEDVDMYEIERSCSGVSSSRIARAKFRLESRL